MPRRIRTPRYASTVAAVAIVSVLLSAAPAVADQPTRDVFRTGRSFEVPALSPALYAVQHPSVDPWIQRTYIEGADGTPIFMETWLPKPHEGNVPPAQLPTILTISPYARKGTLPNSRSSKLMTTLVERGYAYSVAHVRGTGASGGCFDWLGQKEAEDGARLVRYLGEEAPWRDGNVGTFGLSWAGGTQMAAAAMGTGVLASDGTPAVQRYLKAMMVGAPSLLETAGSGADGVQQFLTTPGVDYPEYSLFPDTTPWDVLWGIEPAEDFVEARKDPNSLPAPEHVPGKFTCTHKNVTELWNYPEASVTPFWAERDYRKGLGNITAPVFMWNGFHDMERKMFHQAGLFSHLPATTPRFGLFGQFGHELPGDGDQGLFQDSVRQDFPQMMLAWYDRYLKNQDTGVEQWPIAQVQGGDGQWRNEPEWPQTGGPVGQLALGAGGQLGATAPEGSSSFTESLPFDEASPVQSSDQRVIFETDPLPDRLQITGQPVLDLYVELNKEDAHVAASIAAFDEEGKEIAGSRHSAFRSMQHLDPFVSNRFVQPHAKPAPIFDGSEQSIIHTVLRFNVLDVVIPEGGTLKLMVSGSARVGPGIEGAVFGSEPPATVFEHPSMISGAGATVTVLHDCAHPTALRFVTPRSHPDLINVLDVEVKEPDEPGDDEKLLPRGAPPLSYDGGGVVTQPVCEQAPIRLEDFFGVEI